MKGLPEYCDSCEQMITVKERCYVRLDGTMKFAADVTFRESVCGVWCENCIMVITPEVDNAYG